MKKKITYIGLEPNTLTILSNMKFVEITNVAYLDFFRWSLNPANLIFKLNYIFVLRRNKNLINKKVLFFLKKFTTGIFNRFSDYFIIIFSNNINVIDLEKNLPSKSDLIVTNCWSILKEEIIETASFGALNIHPSKLPKNRGALPTLWSLKNDESSSAVSFLFIDKEIDGGKILEMTEFNINKDDNSIDIESKVSLIVSDKLPGIIEKIFSKNYEYIFQDETLATYTGYYNKYRKINFNEERLRDIFNKIILYPHIEPYCYCYTIIKGIKVYIKGAEYQKINFSRSGLSLDIKGNINFTKENEILRFKIFSDIGLFSTFVLLLGAYLIKNK